jgi:shikimate dehydrogenase
MSGELRAGGVRAAIPGGENTRVYALLGHPVAHSLSPRMQNAALAACGLDAAFVGLDVVPEQVPECLAGLRANPRVRGFNVTLPLKEIVARAVDDLDAAAELTAAVNTVCIERQPAGARLRGFNTDVAGLHAALLDAGVSLRDAVVVVLGAGGAARAAVAAALVAGAAELRVLNRTLARAQEMLDAILGRWKGRVPRAACAGLDAGHLLRGAGVLLQCTSQPMHAPEQSLVSLDDATPDLYVLDMVYRPERTALLRGAAARGLRHANGLGMLVHQGAEAFRLWTGQAAPLAVMRRSVGLE